MKWMIQHIIDYRRAYLIGVVALLVLTIPLLILNPPRIDASFDSVGISENVPLENYRKIREIFPLEKRIYIEVIPKDTSLNLVLADLESVESFFRTAFPNSTIKSIGDIDKIQASFPEAFLEDNSLHEALAVLGEIPAIGNLISRDRNSFMVIFIPQANDETDLIPRIDQVFELDLPYIKDFKFTGQHHIESAVATALAHDLFMLSGIIVLFFVGILLLSFRSFKGVVFSFIIIVLSLIPVLIILSAWNKDLNLITILCIPIVIVLSVADSVHFLTGITTYQQPEVSWKAKIAGAMELYLIPSFLTSFTTSIAFFSLSFSSTQSISDFGIITGLVVLIAFFITYLISPALLMILKPQTQFTAGVFRMFDVIQAYKKPISYSLFGFLVLGILFAPQLRFHNEFEMFLPQHTQAQEDHDHIRDNYYSQATMEVLLGPLEKGMNRDSLLQSITAEIKSWENVMYANSSSDKIKVGSMPFFQINLMKRRNLREEYKSKDRKWERIEIMVSNPDKIMDMEPELLRHLRSFQIPFVYSSPVLMTHQMNRELASNLIKSLAFSWIMIFLSFLLLTKSIRKTLIGMLVNIIPLGFTIVLFYAFDIDLNIVTALTLVVCMGIMVDDTLHAFYRYVVRQADVAELGFGMICTTLILCFGLGAFALSNFRPTVIFGMIASATVLITLLSDLAVLPLLLQTRNE